MASWYLESAEDSYETNVLRQCLECIKLETLSTVKYSWAKISKQPCLVLAGFGFEETCLNLLKIQPKYGKRA